MLGSHLLVAPAACTCDQLRWGGVACWWHEPEYFFASSGKFSKIWCSDMFSTVIKLWVDMARYGMVPCIGVAFYQVDSRISWHMFHVCRERLTTACLFHHHGSKLESIGRLWIRSNLVKHVKQVCYLHIYYEPLYIHMDLWCIVCVYYVLQYSCQFRIVRCLSCQLHIRLKPIKTVDYRPWKHQEWPKEGAFGVFALTATEPMGEKPLCPAKVERWHQ